MKLLLDTHVLVHWLLDHPLVATYRVALDQALGRDEKVAISDISLWEIAKLVERGRLRMRGSVDSMLEQVEEHDAIAVLPMTARIALESTRLGAAFPRDPADQIIAATARCHRLSLMTLDDAIRAAGVVALA